MDEQDAHEQVLTGGNATPVVRIGDNVHRAAGEWSPTVQRLLAHWRAAGADFVPEPRGFDDEGREVVQFLPGEVPTHPMPDWVWGLANLRCAARWLRQLHDASLDFDRTGAIWRSPTHEPAEVICHNDVAPYNMVFDQVTAVGLIDADMASPGPRAWDLSYLAYRMCPFGEDAGAPEADRRLRLMIMLRAYGGDRAPTADEVMSTMVDRLEELADHSDAAAVTMGKPELHRHAAMYRRDAARLRG